MAASADSGEVAVLPSFDLTDLRGRPVAEADLRGRVVIVEFWATWCPPCRSTLSLLGDLKRRYGDQVTVLAVAVESPEADVRNLIKPLNLPVNVVMGSEEVAAPFGTLGSVPRIFVFNRQGKTSAVFYGATPDLHEKVDRLVNSLTK